MFASPTILYGQQLIFVPICRLYSNLKDFFIDTETPKNGGGLSGVASALNVNFVTIGDKDWQNF